MAKEQRDSKIFNRYIGWIGGHLFEKKSIICADGSAIGFYWSSLP